jgi:hypothetical protein
MDVGEAVDPMGIQEVLDVPRLRLAERGRAAVHVAARRARRLPRRDAPHEVEVAVEVDPFARARVVATVLAPEVVHRHDVVAAVGVAARHHPEVERLDDQLYIFRPPHAVAVDDVSVQGMAREEINGELDDGVGVHELAGVGAPDQEDATTLPGAPTGPHAQRVDRPAFDRALRQKHPQEVLREPRRQEPDQGVQLVDRAVHQEPRFRLMP